MRLIIGNDHAAIELKNKIVKHCRELGHEIIDFGVAENEAVDYPDKAEEVCTEYLKGGYDFGIICCGTGIGISISANKIRGIRCALPQNIFASKMAREHNDCNFVAFGGRIDYPDKVEDMLDAFLKAGFIGERHALRVKKINALDSKNISEAL